MFCFPLTEATWLWNRHSGCLPSQRVVRLLVCGIRRTKENTVNQTFYHGSPSECDEEQGLGPWSRFCRGGLGLSWVSQWDSCGARGEEAAPWASAPSLQWASCLWGGQWRFGEPEKYLAGRENINIFTELLNASN